MMLFLDFCIRWIVVEEELPQYFTTLFSELAFLLKCSLSRDYVCAITTIS